MADGWPDCLTVPDWQVHEFNEDYQPKELVLELSRAHVFELAEAFRRMDGKPIKMVYPDFAVAARAVNTPQPAVMRAAMAWVSRPGVLPTGWKTGGPNCVTAPSWQIKEDNEDFYISKTPGVATLAWTGVRAR